MMPFQLKWKLNPISITRLKRLYDLSRNPPSLRIFRHQQKKMKASYLVPGICMSPIHPLKDGIKAISAASSRQLFNITKGLNYE
jgi:hypothetical protein